MQTRTLADRRTVTLAVVLLAVITVVCIAPFAGKAFNIDEPLFIWVARHIQSNFTDPYGFEVNWSVRTLPMWEVTKNPPLASYFIALAAYVIGWNEVALRLLFLLPAVGVALGTFFLARELCARPLEATLAAILTPVFLVSSTSVMCDTMMLAFWVWAAFLWMRGLDRNNHAALAFSAFLIAAGALTKYFGLSLIPLLLAYSVVGTRRLGWWAVHLLIPVAILTGYQWATHSLYGKGLLLDAYGWSSWSREHTEASFLPKCLTGLAFTGGCVTTALLLAPLLWSRKALAGGAALFALLIGLTLAIGRIGEFSLLPDGYPHWLPVIQLSLFGVVGVSLLTIAAADLQKRRDSGAVLLFLWIAGTFVFAALINWSVNGRSVLPMIPAAGILLMRRLEQRKPARSLSVICLLIPAAILALLVTCSDYRFANSARTAAFEIAERYGDADRTVWFQGHWGFHYYMESLGGKAVEYGESIPEWNDIVVIPSNNCIASPPPPGAPVFETLEYASGPLALMDQELGAGFYADLWGPLPFAAGRVSPEYYDIYLLD